MYVRYLKLLGQMTLDERGRFFVLYVRTRTQEQALFLRACMNQGIIVRTIESTDEEIYTLSFTLEKF
jgi:hypothetical protein